ncbi:MAG: hypothetical protein FWC87_01205 [Acidimicrobiaceae bacterium]|nr:hypothetical protein [Acidimicrobiaceae bacterium]
MPLRLKSGWVVATGRKRSTGDMFVLANYEGIGVRERRQPILSIKFTSAEWDRFLENRRASDEGG